MREGESKKGVDGIFHKFPPHLWLPEHFLYNFQFHVRVQMGLGQCFDQNIVNVTFRCEMRIMARGYFFEIYGTDFNGSSKLRTRINCFSTYEIKAKAVQ